MLRRVFIAASFLVMRLAAGVGVALAAPGMG